jgi:hypothetical protein
MNKFLIPLIIAISYAQAAALPPMKLTNLKNELVTVVWKENKKLTAVIFLSALCPCSHSHLSYLTKLKEQHPEVDFLALHSNRDEDSKTVEDYFSKNPLNFPLLKDDKSTWANRLKAYRTPHAYIISSKGEILYQGGVSNSTEVENAKEFYLADALNALKQNQSLKKSQTRVLGCPIARD